MNDYNLQNIKKKSKMNLNNIKIDLSHKFKDDNNDNIRYQYNEEDDRLMYVLITLGLGTLIEIFNEKNISFTDLLLLSKESLKEIGLEMYQRNRIYNFSTSFNRFAKTYSIKEISDFFSSNKQFLFSPTIYNKMMKDKEKNNYNYDNAYIYKNYFSDDDNNNNNYKQNKYKYNIYKNNPTKILSEKKYKQHKSKLPISSKSYKASKIFKKYLIIKKGVDEFLNKLNKQKEDTETMSYKYNAFIKRSANVNENNMNLNSLDFLNNKNSTKKMINNLNINDENEDIFKLLEDNDENININMNNAKNINDEYNKLINKMNKLEQMKIDDNSLEHLNQIKKYINEKGLNLKNDEILSLKNEIDKITEIINKKEKLKQNLEKYNKKIEQRKKIIYKLENEYNDNNDNNENNEILLKK